MGQFDWFKSIGATDEAVAVLNDQPELFTTLLLVIVGLTLQCLLIWYIHFATLKPEQKKKKKEGGQSKIGGFLRGLSSRK
jgi:hypothetical protein